MEGIRQEKSYILDILVECRLQDEVGREKLENRKVPSLEGKGTLVEFDRYGLVTKYIANSKQRISLCGGQLQKGGAMHCNAP